MNYKIVILIIIFVGLILGGGGFSLYQSQKNQVQDGPQNAASKEQDKLIEEVGKLTDLPADETPAIITIADVTKLQGQPFFQNAKNGYKVLIYTNAAKVILYDPVTKKVIDVGSINIGTKTKESLPKVALRNGTKTVGLTTEIENKLKKEKLQFEVSSKENAGKQSYDKTVVVVLNESGRDFAQSMANLLDASTGALPKDESKPQDADIMVILGKDSI